MKKKKEVDVRNSVAKFAHLTNKCVAFKDKTKYNRKHKFKQEDFISVLA